MEKLVMMKMQPSKEGTEATRSTMSKARSSSSVMSLVSILYMAAAKLLEHAKRGPKWISSPDRGYIR